LENLQAGKLIARSQKESGVSYAKKINKQEANIDWQQSAKKIERMIRAFNAWPIAYTYLGSRRVRIWQAQVSDTSSDKPPGTILGNSKQSIEVVTGESALKLIAIQLEGGKVIGTQDFLNAHDMSGRRFTAQAMSNDLKESV
jgi:methionyl-tRNA formyltransferase